MKNNNIDILIVSKNTDNYLIEESLISLLTTKITTKLKKKITKIFSESKSVLDAILPKS